MSENLRNFTKAVYTMDAVVNRVSADSWDNQSPCDQWSAKQVLGHSIWGMKNVTSWAGAGDKPAEMPEAEVAGADPARSWSTVRDGVLAALDRQGVLGQEIEGPFGPATLDNSLGIVTMDLTTHAWDIAKATGQQAVIPMDLAATTYETIKSFGDGARRPGVFNAEVEVDGNADIVAKMVAMAGRQP